MSIHLPPNVVHEVASCLRARACPVYDAEKDVVALNEAFGFEGVDRIPPEETEHAKLVTAYPRDKASEMLSCLHCVDAGIDVQACLKTTFSGLKGRSRWKSSVHHGDAIRRVVLEAHGNDCAAWLACEIKRSTERPSDVPTWFAALWLPLHDMGRTELEKRVTIAGARDWSS